MSVTIRTPFTNLQQELLQIYAQQVSEQDLANIKELIGQYFAEKLTALADSAWEQNSWTDQDMEDILNDPRQ